MRKWLCMVACCLSVYVQAQVWTLKEKEPAAPGTWWCFRNTVTLEELPRSLELRLAADTKYWLWVNGELQVSEGGLKRGPNPSDTYCDVITSLPALRAGKNTVLLRFLPCVRARIPWPCWCGTLARMVSAIAIPLRQASVSPFPATVRRWNPMQNGG